MVTRRRLLQTGAAALAIGALGPQTAWSRAFSVGDMTLATLSDGALTLPASFIFEPMDAKALPEALAPFGLAVDGTLTPPCNVTLLRSAGRVILFDAGAGASFQAGAGQLVDALDAAGLAPEDVTHVVFTHGHPDHLWGVLDDFDEPLFSSAVHMMGRNEFAYWTDNGTVDSIGEARKAFAVGARRRLETLGDAITLIDDGEEILPGVAARMTPGHTPGHMAFEVRSGSESALILGDAIGNHHVAFAKPDWPSGSDQDQARAAKTRRALLDQASAEQTPVIGFHLPDGGAGRVERQDGAFRFAPLEG